jgi:hypothetical protein
VIITTETAKGRHDVAETRELATKATGPLAGVRILDLTSVVFGSYATQILGDQGAEVIKIEDPGSGRGDGGDIMRWAGHVPQGAPRDLGPIFLTINRNNRSVVVDMKDPASRPLMEALIASCEVFATSIRYEGLKRLGLAYEDVRVHLLPAEAQAAAPETRSVSRALPPIFWGFLAALIGLLLLSYFALNWRNRAWVGLDELRGRLLSGKGPAAGTARGKTP